MGGLCEHVWWGVGEEGWEDCVRRFVVWWGVGEEGWEDCVRRFVV